MRSTAPLLSHGMPQASAVAASIRVGEGDFPRAGGAKAQKIGEAGARLA